MNTNLKSKPELNRSLVAIITSVVFTCVIGSFQDLGSTNQSQARVANRVENLASLSVAKPNPAKAITLTPNTSSKRVEETVIRGTKNTYLLAARGGQLVNIEVTSLEENAVFTIIAPNGDSLLQETFSWKGVLPETGEYQIVVGGTRGNATYNLAVAID